MNRRTLLLALVALAARPAWAQAVDVSAIDAYLRALRSATGGFRQINPNGSVQAGRFFLAKPGRMRFEYETPAGAMVIADGINVAVFDPKSNRVSSRYPLGRTPLSLLLRDDVSLAEPGLVLGATRSGDVVDITAVDPRAPNDGRMVMTFGMAPITLRQWAITTRTGQRTTVELIDMQPGAALSRSLFNIELEEAKLR